MRLPQALFTPPIAHRGLWAPGGAPENSLAAFDSACRAGFGVELDVRLSSDGAPMVFHDDSLERLTGEAGAIETMTARELCELPLLGGAERIPSLEQTLERVAGRAMLLVELKRGPDAGDALAARAGELLERYSGPAAVISFDAEALAWFSAQGSALPRGLDAMGLDDPAVEAAFERSCSLADPQFLVLELGSLRAPAAVKRRAEGQPVIAWTVRSGEDTKRVAGDCDNIIFEGLGGG